MRHGAEQTPVGVSRVPKAIADRLVNSTYRIPGDEQHYVVQLDVFHQLHCLVSGPSDPELEQMSLYMKRGIDNEPEYDSQGPISGLLP